MTIHPEGTGSESAVHLSRCGAIVGQADPIMVTTR